MENGWMDIRVVYLARLLNFCLCSTCVIKHVLVFFADRKTNSNVSTSQLPELAMNVWVVTGTTQCRDASLHFLPHPARAVRACLRLPFNPTEIPLVQKDIEYYALFVCLLNFVQFPVFPSFKELLIHNRNSVKRIIWHSRMNPHKRNGSTPCMSSEVISFRK